MLCESDGLNEVFSPETAVMRDPNVGAIIEADSRDLSNGTATGLTVADGRISTPGPDSP